MIQTATDAHEVGTSLGGYDNRYEGRLQLVTDRYRGNSPGRSNGVEPAWLSSTLPPASQGSGTNGGYSGSNGSYSNRAPASQGSGTNGGYSGSNGSYSSRAQQGGNVPGEQYSGVGGRPSEQQRGRSLTPMRSQSREQSANRSPGPGPGLCFGCGQPGHLRKDCPIASGDQCHNCGQEGHRRKQCTRPALGEEGLRNLPCSICKGKGHFRSYCPKLREQSPAPPRQ